MIRNNLPRICHPGGEEVVRAIFRLAGLGDSGRWCWVKPMCCMNRLWRLWVSVGRCGMVGLGPEPLLASSFHVNLPAGCAVVVGFQGPAAEGAFPLLGEEAVHGNGDGGVG